MEVTLKSSIYAKEQKVKVYNLMKEHHDAFSAWDDI